MQKSTNSNFNRVDICEPNGSLISPIASFSHQRSLLVFYFSLSDSKSCQIFSTLLSILADFNATVCTVSILPDFQFHQSLEGLFLVCKLN